jgi:hypothetical protein
MNRFTRMAFALGLGVRVCLATPSAWLGPTPSGNAYPAGEEERQFAMLTHDLQQREHFQRVAGETFRSEALIRDTDRDPLDVILHRSESLLADLQRMPKAPDISTLASELGSLRTLAEQTVVSNAPACRAVFDRACRVRRQIAFANPLFEFP